MPPSLARHHRVCAMIRQSRLQPKSTTQGGDFGGFSGCYLIWRRSGRTAWFFFFFAEGLTHGTDWTSSSRLLYTQLFPSISPSPSPLGLRQKAREQPDRSMTRFRLGAALSLAALRSCWWCETMGVKWMQLSTQERRRRPLGSHTAC